ncbi:MAG: oligosaccharide flippase family protein [Maribacter sp.]|nr:oligosaccharide flippase family protein [Maribacter sp.]
MGIVLKQSFNNTIITYIGFGVGAINTLFLYTNFLTDAYYGLVNVILSASAVLMPFLAFGVPNTLIKYYSSFKNEKTSDGFLTLMLLLPIVLILPIAAISYFAYDLIGNFLSKENAIVKGYLWYIFWIGLSMAYFEVFYAWARIRMKSVFGNFMKEVFSRIGITFLLLLIYFGIISVETFLKAMVGMYLLRTLIMNWFAFSLRRPVFRLDFPKNMRAILIYSTLIILGGSAAIILLEIDKVMINQFIEIKNVAYYSVAGFIAMVIAVPSRSMHQITYPMTAEYINKRDSVSLKVLYQKSSLTLFIIAGFLFLLIFLNLNDLYDLLPKPYRDGFMIVFWLGLAKVYDSVIGNNNAIMYNSDYYYSVLAIGVLLAILAILFNLWLIPKYGLDGAAIASFLAFFIYNSIKLLYVKLKFHMSPFTAETLKVLVLLVAIAAIFYYLRFPFHPVFNIILKSILMSILYLGVLYRFRISEDVFGMLNRFLKRN